MFSKNFKRLKINEHSYKNLCVAFINLWNRENKDNLNRKYKELIIKKVSL